MKQHITVEQAKEDPYVFQKVMTYLGVCKHVYDGIVEDGVRDSEVREVNIGRMIEIIEKHISRPVAINYFYDHGAKRDIYFDDKAGNFHNYEAEELCDALWKAVKAVLE